MSDKRKFEQEYIELQNRTAPDLWDRIEAGLEPKDICQAEVKEPEIEPHIVQPVHKIARYMKPGIAVAACAALIVSVSFLGNLTRFSSKVSSETFAVDSGDNAAGGTDVEETTAYTDQSKIGETAISPVKSVRYEDLPLEAATSIPAPKHVKTANSDLYFSEDILRDTQLLCQARISRVSYDYDDSGAAYALSYQIDVGQLLYSEDYMQSGSKLTVRSEIDDAALLDGKVLYALLENRTYLLPLEHREDGYWLVFPFAPQIEVTQNQEYIFHNGWQSLINDDAYVVINEQSSPEDFYYDRMMMRQGPAVVEELISLVEAVHRDGRS